MTKIARTLNEQKIPTKTKTALWEVQTIKGILTNPTYIGKVRYSTEDENRYFEVDGHHERIIDDELFYLTQERIKNISYTIKTKRPRAESYFCGVLYCGMCKSKLTTHNYSVKSENEEKLYKTSYRCHKRKFCYGDETCKCPDIVHDKVERAFTEYIQNINEINETADIEIEEFLQKAEQELLQSIVSYEKQLIALQSRKKQTMELYASSQIEFEEYKEVVRVMNERGDVLESELQRKKAELATATKLPEVLPEDIITNINQNWEHLSDNEKMIFLQRFIKKITITIEKKSKTNNIVKIDSIEFHTGELPKREIIRSKLR